MGQIIHSNYSVPGTVLDTLARTVKKQSKNTVPMVGVYIFNGIYSVLLNSTNKDVSEPFM